MYFSVLAEVSGPDPKRVKARACAFSSSTNGLTKTSSSGVAFPVLEPSGCIKSWVAFVPVSLLYPFLQQHYKAQLRKLDHSCLLHGTTIRISNVASLEQSHSWVKEHPSLQSSFPEGATGYLQHVLRVEDAVDAASQMFDRLSTDGSDWRFGWKLSSGQLAFRDVGQIIVALVAVVFFQTPDQNGTSFASVLKLLPVPPGDPFVGQRLSTAASPFGCLAPFHFANLRFYGHISALLHPANCHQSHTTGNQPSTNFANGNTTSTKGTTNYASVNTSHANGSANHAKGITNHAKDTTNGPTNSSASNAPLLVLDIAMFPGTEGGPILDAANHLLGIITLPLCSPTGEISLALSWQSVVSCYNQWCGQQVTNFNPSSAPGSRADNSTAHDSLSPGSMAHSSLSQGSIAQSQLSQARLLCCNQRCTQPVIGGNPSSQLGSGVQGSHAHGAIPQDTMARSSISQGSMLHRSLPQGSMTQGSMLHGRMAHGSMPDASMPHSSVSQGSMACSGMSQGITDSSLAHTSLQQGSISDGSMLPDSTLARSIPAFSIPVLSTPAHSIPAHSTPAHSIPAHSIPAHSTPAHSTPALSTPAQSISARLNMSSSSMTHGIPPHSSTCDSRMAFSRDALAPQDLPEASPTPLAFTDAATLQGGSKNRHLNLSLITKADWIGSAPLSSFFGSAPLELKGALCASSGREAGSSGHVLDMQISSMEGVNGCNSKVPRIEAVKDCCMHSTESGLQHCCSKYPSTSLTSSRTVSPSHVSSGVSFEFMSQHSCSNCPSFDLACNSTLSPLHLSSEMNVGLMSQPSPHTAIKAVGTSQMLDSDCNSTPGLSSALSAFPSMDSWPSGMMSRLTHSHCTPAITNCPAGFPSMDGLLPGMLSHLMHSIVMVKTSSSWATGVVINNSGMLVTNAHLFDPGRGEDTIHMAETSMPGCMFKSPPVKPPGASWPGCQPVEPFALNLLGSQTVKAGQVKVKATSAQNAKATSVQSCHGQPADAMCKRFCNSQSVHAPVKPPLNSPLNPQCGPRYKSNSLVNPASQLVKYTSASHLSKPALQLCEVRHAAVDEDGQPCFVWSPAEVIYVFRGHLDMAVLQLVTRQGEKAAHPPAAALASSSSPPYPGQPIFCLSHGMLGPWTQLPAWATFGTVAKVIQLQQQPVMLLSSTTVHSGSSGAGLFNMDGDVVGLVTSNTRHVTGATFPKLSFSIPADLLRPLWKWAARVEGREREWLGRAGEREDWVAELKGLDIEEHGARRVWNLQPPFAPNPIPVAQGEKMLKLLRQWKPAPSSESHVGSIAGSSQRPNH